MTEPGMGFAMEPGCRRAGVGTAGEFAGLAALVTGGASGIGFATARMLADRGVRVAILFLDLALGNGDLVTQDQDLAQHCEIGEL